MKAVAPAPPKRRKLPESTWQGVRLAFIAGGGLRQLAREANISEGTLLARAAREKWSQQRDEAARRAKGGNGESEEAAERQQQSLAIITRETLMDLHLNNMLSVSHKLSNHANGLPTAELFQEVRKVDVADRIARRQLGLDKDKEPLVQLNMFGSNASATSLMVFDANVCAIEADEA